MNLFGMNLFGMNLSGMNLFRIPEGLRPTGWDAGGPGGTQHEVEDLQKIKKMAHWPRLGPFQY